MCAGERRFYNVRFLCQHNSARSIFGEALVNSIPDSGLRAYSAGSDPADAVHPQALALLESLSIPTDNMSRRLHLFMSLPIASRDRLTLQRDVDAIGRDISVASSEPET